MQLPVVALVGRPNVGKSTLFNRLTRTRDALVADFAGVTRDRQYGYAHFGQQKYIAVDTGGIGQDNDTVDAASLEQVAIALEEADIIFFITDVSDGLTPADEIVADQLRRHSQPVYVICNKAEGLSRMQATADFYALGLGEPWAISAQRGDRIEHLLNHSLVENLKRQAPEDDIFTSLDDSQQNKNLPKGIRLSLIGRPNVGKSTLVNRFLGEQRMLAMDMPGTTRDAIASSFNFDERDWTIVDTAGIRRQARVHDSLERLSIIKAMQAAEDADVAIIMLDAQQGLSTQDLRLLSLTQQRGRPAVIAVNKWDGLSPKIREKTRQEMLDRFGSYDYLPLCYISAFHGSGLRELLDAAYASYQAGQAKMTTPALSRALEQFIGEHAPPISQGRRIKLRFAHQGGEQPPTIVIHGTQTQRLPDEYKRYLIRRFREKFNLFGTPIRLVFKNSVNPYAKKATKKRRRSK